MSILIKSARIVDSRSENHLKKRNIFIDDDGVIRKTGQESPKADVVIEGDNLHVSIGWFDMRANFNDPGLEQKEDLATGRKAAAAGGFTEVALLPNTEPPIQSKNDVNYITSANKNNLVQLHAIGAITKGCQGEDLTEMIDMQQAGAVAFSDGDKPVWNTDILLKTLLYLQKFNGLLINRPEDKHLTAFGVVHEGRQSTLLGLKGMPDISEEIMIKRDLKLLDYAGGKLHFANLSSAEAVSLLKKAKADGKAATSDVAIANLLYDDNYLSDYDTNYKVNPPLRETKDRKALIKGVKDGVIDVIVSAHSPQDEECKKLEFDLADFGMSTIQTFLPMLLQVFEAAELPEIVEKFTVNPRKILGLPIPEIKTGAPANLTVFDPGVEWQYNAGTNYSRSKNSPLYQSALKGKVTAVVNNGKYLTW